MEPRRVRPSGARSPDPGGNAELVDLVGRGASVEGISVGQLDGLRFHRSSRPAVVQRFSSLGPSITVVAQGAKVASYRGATLPYDPLRYLAITAEASFDSRVIEASAARPFLAMCYDIPPDVVAKLLLCFADDRTVPIREPVPAFVGQMTQEISACVVRLLRAIEDPLERRVVAPLVVEELVFRLLRSDAAATIRSAVGGDRDGEKIRTAMRYFQTNVARPISVADAAHHVAMSPSHFAHRFRAVARVSPMRYLKQLRLQHARSLIVVEGLRVNEAAARAGYESTSHFTRDFRGLFGAAPGEYARRLREA